MDRTKRRSVAGRRSRRANATADDSPFYAPKPDAREVQQRVLQEARASAAERFVTTSRPFTPADRSRGLFGASTRERPSTASAAPADARPPSAFPMGRRQFLEMLPQTHDLSRPPTAGTRLPPVPPSEPGSPATQQKQPETRSRSQSTVGDRPVRASGSARPPSGRVRRQMPRPPSGRRGSTDASATGDATGKILPTPPPVARPSGQPRRATDAADPRGWRRSTSADQVRVCARICSAACRAFMAVAVRKCVIFLDSV